LPGFAHCGGRATSCGLDRLTWRFALLHVSTPLHVIYVLEIYVLEIYVLEIYVLEIYVLEIYVLEIYVLEIYVLEHEG
jgi:hypothetical protein